MTYTEGDNRAPLFSNPDISYMGTPAGSYDPDDPATGSFAPADPAQVLDGDYAYVLAAGSGGRVVNISDPVNPFDVGSFPTSEIAQDARVVGSYLYMIEYSPFTETSIGPSYLRILDISKPSIPEQTGFLKMPGSAQSLVVVGDYAYVAHWDTNYHAIRIININNPL
jgi:hypothetical protein